MSNVHGIGKKEKTAIETLPALSGEPGKRLYLCMGPFCWGRGTTAREAVRNAAKNRVRIYEGDAGWRWAMFDVPSDAYVDGMGFICSEALALEDGEIRKLGTFGMNEG